MILSITCFLSIITDDGIWGTYDFSIVPKIVEIIFFEITKTAIGREKCYRICDWSNTLCTRPTGGTKKIKGLYIRQYNSRIIFAEQL